MNSEDIISRMVISEKIVEPKLIWDLLYVYEDSPDWSQSRIIEELIRISKKSLHNPLLLLNNTTQITPDNTKLYILNLLADLSLLSQIPDHLFDLISYLVYSYDIKKSNILHLLHKFPTSTPNQLILIIRFLQLYLISSKICPYSYFYFNSVGSGVSLHPIEYPFTKAISVCAWIRLEESWSVSRLFTFHCKGSGGLEAYIVDNKLYYRTLGPDYNPPARGSNGILLETLPVLTWVLVTFEHQKAAFGKKQLKVVVDGKETLNSMMDFPKINSELTTTASIGLDFFGQISCIMFFNEVLTVEKMKKLYLHCNNGPQNYNSLINIEKFIVGNVSKSLVIVLHPERTHKNFVYNAVNESAGTLQGLAGVKCFVLQKNSSFGGIKAFLPMLPKILESESGDLLIEWFRLIMLSLKDRPDNQSEAVSSSFFKLLAESLENTPNKMVTEEILNIIDDIKNSANNKLPEHIFINLLWNIKLWGKGDLGVQTRVLVILKAMYLKNKSLIRLIGIDYMLDSLKYLHLNDSIRGLLDIIKLVLGVHQDSGHTESFIKYLCTKPTIEVQIALLESIASLISESNPNYLTFIKHIIDSKGIEIILWLMESKTLKIKTLCTSILEVLLKFYKSSLYSLQDFYSYIALKLKIEEDFEKTSEQGVLDEFSKENEFKYGGNKNPNIIRPRSSSRKSSFSSEAARNEDSLYHTVLEIVLNRSIESSSILDDTDYIQSLLGLYILQSVVSKSSPEIKHKALQDQLMLTKWNPKNCDVLISNSEWHYWVLDIIYQTSDHLEAADAIVDIGIRLHTTVLSQGMNHPNAFTYLNRMILWLEINNKALKARNLVKKLLESFITASAKLSEMTEVYWNNLIQFAYVIEEFVLYSNARSDEKLSEDIVRSKDWDDSCICAGYFNLISDIWAKTNEIQNFEGFCYLIKDVAPGLFRNEAFVFNFLADGDLKHRGKAGLVLFHLVCTGIMGSEGNSDIEYWLDLLERMVLILLFISESNKKTLIKQESKVYSFCLSYSIGYLASVSTRHEARPLILKTLAKLIKYIFFTFSINSAKNQYTGLKSILKINLAQYNYPCDYVVASILNFNPGYESWDTMIIKFTIKEIISLFELKDMQHALSNLYFDVKDKFHNSKKVNAICLDREKTAENILIEFAFNASKNEINAANILENIMAVVYNIKLEVNAKTIQRNLANKIKTYKRQNALQKIFKISTKKDLEAGYKVEKSLCKDFSRPFLRPKSSKQKYVCNKKKPNPDSIINIDYTSIQRPALKDEDEEDLMEDAKIKLAEDSAKNTKKFSAAAGIITPLGIKYGYASIKPSKKELKLIFTYDESIKEIFHSGIELFTFNPEQNFYYKTWRLSLLINIFPKSYLMKQTSVELVFSDGKNVLLNFISSNDRVEFLLELKKLKKTFTNFKISKPKILIKAMPLSSYQVKIMIDLNITEKWVNWQISSFEYLLYLNFCAGRSYNDLTQYPVMPWLISEYGPTISETSYRDLSKNMGSLGSPERTSIFADRYKNMSNDGSDFPFHFGSHYSNPAIALFYLIRLSPYDEGAKELQGGKFDLADRLFSSVIDSYVSAIEDIADVREIIPEFFFLPEMFYNINNLDLGVTQNAEVINDVKLPLWAKNPYEFTRISKEALESDVVSNNLNKWIDLIFGYKQLGIEAEKAMNVFYYMTYENNIDVETVTDPQLLSTIKTQIFHFGKTPTQLFSKPHPVRKPLSKLIDTQNLLSNYNEYRIYFSPLSKLNKGLNFISARSILKIKILKDKEIYCIRYNRSISKLILTKNLNDNGGYFSCEPVANVEYFKENIIQCEDISINTYNPPYHFLQSCKSVVFGGYWDGRLSIRKFNSSEILNLKFYHSTTITCIEVNDDEKIAVSGSRDGDCVVWTIENDYWVAKHNLSAHEDEVTSICISEDLHRLATCSLDGKCLIYYLDSFKVYKQIILPNNKPITMGKFSSSVPSKILLYSPEDRSISSYSLNGVLLSTIEETWNVTVLSVIKYITSEDYVLYGNDKGEIFIRKSGNFEKVRSYTLASPILSISLTSDYKHMLVGCSDGEIAILT